MPTEKPKIQFVDLIRTSERTNELVGAIISQAITNNWSMKDFKQAIKVIHEEIHPQ